MQYKKKIKIYNKKFKKYLEDKKHLLDKRLENEREIRKKYGNELDQNIEEEYIIGFVKPVGKHSQQEFQKNAPKYQKIAKMMKNLQSKGVKGNIYWRIITNTAHKISGLENDKDIQREQEIYKNSMKNNNKGRER